jgi:hypothetical protein
MPTKRRLLLFLIVLSVMLLIKYAASQETAQVGWDGEHGLGSIEDYVQGTMFAGLLLGTLAGLVLVLRRNLAAREGHYFSGDLVTVRISRRG